MLFLYVVHSFEVEFGFVKFFLTLGVDDAFDDGLYDDKIVENEYEVVIVDFLDVLGDETSLLVKHLAVGDDLGLAGRALLLFFLELGEVVVDEYLVVEGDGVSIGFIPVYYVSQLVAVLVVYLVFLVVVLLLQHVLVELVLTVQALLFQFLLLPGYAILLYFLECYYVQFCIPLDLQGKFPVQFREVGYVA